MKTTLLTAGLLIGVALVFAACAPLMVINGLVPGDTYRAERDIAYGALARQKLDVFMPVRPAAGGAGPATGGAAGAPVIVFFYGGNWNSGARGDYLFAGEAFASQGFVTVLADYRLFPEVKFPDFLHDSARAFAWVEKNITRFGGDPRRIVLAGHSAGAYNAAMLAFDPAYLRAAGADPASVKAFVGLAGPYDFIPMTNAISKQVFGFPDTPPQTQPINFVPGSPGARLPPVLLLTAPDDTTVRPGNSERLAAKLRAAGGEVKEISYSGLDHRRIVGALAAPLRGLAPVLADVTAFVRQLR